MHRAMCCAVTARYTEMEEPRTIDIIKGMCSGMADRTLMWSYSEEVSLFQVLLFEKTCLWIMEMRHLTGRFFFSYISRRPFA